MKVFLTGATGFVGSNLIPKLLERDINVTALVRKGSKNINLIKHFKIEIIEGNINEPLSYRRHLADSDLVVNLIGVVTDWAPKNVYYDIHVSGLKRLLDECINVQVKKVIHLSTIDIHEKKTSTISENTPTSRSKAPYIHSKLIGESIALGYTDKFEVVIIRPVWIYGVGDTVLFPEIAYQISRGQMVLIGDKEVYISLVHVKNLCDAIMLAMEKKGINKEAFIISDGEKTLRALVDELAVSLNYKKPKVLIPYNIAYAAGLTFELIAKMLRFKKRPLLTRTAVEMLGKTMRIDTSKAKELLTYHPKISLDQGLKEVVAWLRSGDLEELRKK